MMSFDFCNNVVRLLLLAHLMDEDLKTECLHVCMASTAKAGLSASPLKPHLELRSFSFFFYFKDFFYMDHFKILH